MPKTLATRAQKRPALTDKTRERYYADAIDNNWSVADLADRKNITYNQARNIMRKGKGGKLAAPNVLTRKKDLTKALQKDFDAILNEQIKYAAAQLDVDTGMNAVDRVTMLHKLAATKKEAQKMSIEAHLKTTDAVLIAAIIRRYEPDATDDRVIKIYYEELEKWKHSVV